MLVRHQAPAKAKARVIVEDKRKFSAYITLRKARADARLLGIRAKRVEDAVENPDDVTKVDKIRSPRNNLEDREFVQK